jgi:hypothetical protein
MRERVRNARAFAFFQLQLSAHQSMPGVYSDGCEELANALQFREGKRRPCDHLDLAQRDVDLPPPRARSIALEYANTTQRAELSPKALAAAHDRESLARTRGVREVGDAKTHQHLEQRPFVKQKQRCMFTDGTLMRVAGSGKRARQAGSSAFSLSSVRSHASLPSLLVAGVGVPHAPRRCSWAIKIATLRRLRRLWHEQRAVPLATVRARTHQQSMEGLPLSAPNPHTSGRRN